MRSFFRRKKTRVEHDRPPAARSESSKTILIVDDSPTETHVIKNILEKGGYQALTAADGETGMATAIETKPDLILMDVVMPGLNGFQATRQLSRNPETENIPIIMVTTKSQETDRAWGLRQGAQEYVVKPVAAQELLGKIHAVLGG